MIPVLGFLIGGAAAATLAKTRRKSVLLDKIALSEEPPAIGETPVTMDAKSPPSQPAPVIAYLQRWDERYQSLVQTHIDPYLMGRLRNEQMLALARGELRELNYMEKRANRGLLMGGVGFALAGLTELTGWPLAPVIVGLGLYTCWPGIEEAWRLAYEERRFSLLHLTQMYSSPISFR
jgi:hypothetical protein